MGLALSRSVSTKPPKWPAGVPADARWVEADKEWEQGELDGRGQKQGPFTNWRFDGTKCNECFLIDGQAHGPFRRFHENGELAQDGTFVDGVLHGTRRWYASTGLTTERMHEGGVSEAVRRSEMDYVRGRVVAVRHFDEQGRRVTPQGDVYPERPAAVDEGAEFRPDESQWTKGQADGETAERVGAWKTWSAGGELLEEASYLAGARHGPARLFVTAAASPFADPRIRCEAGTFEAGARVGLWSLLDEGGGVLATLSYGKGGGLDVGELEAWSNEVRPDWEEKGLALLRADEAPAALVTLARACVVSRSTAPYLAGAAGRTAGLTTSAAETLAEETASELPALASALVSGASVPHVLRKLAIVLDQSFQSRAALDFVNAALLFSPSSTEFLFTRALVLVSLGLKEQAEKDAGELAPSSPEQAEFLLDYLRFLFPTYGFWPAAEKPSTTYDGLPEAPVKTLEQVMRVAQKYATRLTLIRRHLLGMVNERCGWLVPDVSRLLPDGPVALEVGELEVPAGDGDDGPRLVSFDETLAVEDMDLPSAVRAARADWNALTWLLWSSGESTVKLPGALTPPGDFAQAAGMSAQRLWRSRDQRVFEGKNAKAHGVPSFEWEGADLGELHPNLASIAEQQYAEMQAMFYWLSRDDVQSPWQEDLRGS